MKNYLLLLLLVLSIFSYSQNPTVSGFVKDGSGKPLEFVNILLYETEGKTPVKGVVTEENGSFSISLSEEKTYRLQASFIGYKTVNQNIEPPFTSLTITLEEDAEMLDETVVTAKKPIIKREPGKLVFTVENSSFSTGNTMNLLSKTPGVLVLGSEISIKNLPTIIYINGKRVYLSSNEVMSLLSSMDASIVKEIEVITNPSAKYDAEAGAVLNIITSKAVSIGYKGSVTTGYEQGIYPKYSVTTSHFYKNKWLNIYGSYTFGKRKEWKQDDSKVRFFNPDNTTKSFWNTDFEKTLRFDTHQANFIADITLNDKNSLSVSVNGFLTPEKTANNVVVGEIRNSAAQLDSTFSTVSRMVNDTRNITFNVTHTLSIGEKGTLLTTSGNYIKYNNTQDQALNTDYFSPIETITHNVNFFTQAQQESDIFVAQTDLSSSFAKGTIETGLKYSSINTSSGLDFYDNTGNTPQLNTEFSDLFDYTENVFAAYVSYLRVWEKWNIEMGLRAENTNVTGDSKSLGIVNRQDYLQWFPTVSVLYTLENGNPVGLSYKRSISRPRYQGLNPFRYFITDNFFDEGNPRLVPEINDKITLSYTHKNKWFFEFYYWHYTNPLTISSFLDNPSQTMQQLDINGIYNFQYSFDVTYAGFVSSWWYLQASTSSFYMENKFYSVKSVPETYSYNTLGFFANIFNRFYLTKDRKFSADVTYYHLSDLISGTLYYKNQRRLNVSFWKSLWDKRASLALGVNDVFNTYNVPVFVDYYNQDFTYFPRIESRLFHISFTYNFGNARLRDNKRTIKVDEEQRLK